MKKIHRIAFLLLSLAFTFHPLRSQRNLNAQSHLTDSTYFRHAIKSISDADLFSAIDLSSRALGEVSTATAKKDYPASYAAWAQYWSAKHQPKYVTKNYHLLIDTDMLVDYDSLRSYVRQYPEERDSILHRAEMLVQHRIQAWGDIVLEFGPAVDFNRNVGQSGKYGFHYWIWSRPLNAAYVLTGNERYLEAFDDYFRQWYDQRNRIEGSIPDLDVVYYELGLGVRNRMFIEHYLLPYSHRTWQTHEKMLKTILGAARWLYELERWEGYRSGNWQIHGSYMLTQIALTFPEFRESSNWLQLGLQRMHEHLEQDFFEDGGHSERSPRNYTQATYVAYRNLYYLLTNHNQDEPLARAIRERMSRTIDWWITMLAPTGEIPAINDSHRGLLPVFLLQDAASFYGKPEIYGVLANLFGIHAPAAGVSLPAFTSRNMPSSGFAVMRTDWTRNALYMNINYGKWNGSHTHNDMLDFEFYANGRALAVDAGLGLTYDDPLYVPWYKSSAAHNMVTVNNSNIEREGTEGREVTWYSSETLDYFGGEHLGYNSKGVVHRRSIAFVKPFYWVINDRLVCKKAGDTLSWNLHTPLHLMKSQNGLSTSEAPGFKLFFSPSDARMRQGDGMAASTSDVLPGRTERIQWIAFDQISTTTHAVEFTVVLVPVAAAGNDIDVREIGAGAVLVHRGDTTEILRFGSHPLPGDSLATDAEFVMVRAGRDGRQHFMLANGTYLRTRGAVIWKSDTKKSSEGLMPGR